MLPSPPETRASLILRLQDAADVAAWEEVMAIYGPLVVRMAQQQGLQLADAEDVAQDVFSAVVSSIERWCEQPKRGRFRGWLLSITRHIAINALTRRPKGTVGVGGWTATDPLHNIPAQDAILSSQFDYEYQREVYRWAAEQVRQCVSDKTWEAFRLSHVEDKRISEVAQQLGMSNGNVYICRSRVMSRLRDVVRQFELAQDGSKRDTS
ncbi:MAG: sigma-70 family RNA polymerase sigma factor [Planctomycetales bacterium]|nr:sigma-70 family RNA polymerase sigma factor [Planctomycetales bacterium]